MDAIIDDALLQHLTTEAAACPRGRTNHNLHGELADPVQRLLNAIEPGSYVRPHRHTAPPRWELFAILSGRATVLLFDDTGRVLERAELAAGGPTRVVEIPPGAWHTVTALETATVLLEVKPGPYRPVPAHDFAGWAPAEGEAGCAALVQWFTAAGPGAAAPRP